MSQHCHGCGSVAAEWVFTCETCKQEHCNKCSNMPSSLHTDFVHVGCKPLKDRIIAEAVKLLPGLPGWCSPKKAGKLIRFILSEQASCCVELGVFGGSSLIPQALALRALGAGRIIGIDPYSTAEALKTPPKEDPNSRWWAQLDLDKIKRELLDRLDKLGLAEFASVRQQTSDAAAIDFAEGSIDLLHIDGNHSEEQALRDADTWLPKLRPGGILFFDDISWGFDRFERSTTGPAIDLIMQHCSWLGEVNQCLICRKR